MLKTTKIIFADKKLDEESKKIIEGVQENNPHLQKLKTLEFSRENFTQSVALLTESDEELAEWKKRIEAYELEMDEVEYDFYTFFDELPLPFPFLSEGIGDPKWDGLYDHKIYSFDFEGAERLYDYWVRAREEI